MKVSDFNFELPEELIANYPVPDRKSSRLLILDSNNGEIRHSVFKDVLV